jgi:ACS family tartrate transporter-like MFS transporter
MILYFTSWFPRQPRPRSRLVMTAIPASIALGAPISTAFLELDRLLGLRGWSRLFLGEALPVILSSVLLMYCTDRSAQAHWLAPQEREWLLAELQAERTAGRPGPRLFRAPVSRQPARACALGRRLDAPLLSGSLWALGGMSLATIAFHGMKTRPSGRYRPRF